MQRARDLMTTDVVSVTRETEITEAARLLLEHRFNGLPVVDADKHLVGIICQSDLITQQKKLQLPSLFTLLDGIFPLTASESMEKEMKKITAATVADAMTPDPTTVAPDTPLDEIATLMVDGKFHTLPVVDNGILAGILGKEDILRTLLASAAQKTDATK